MERGDNIAKRERVAAVSGRSNPLRKIRTGRHRLPRGNLLLPLRQLVAKTCESNLAQDQVQRRLRRVGYGDNRLDSLLRVAAAVCRPGCANTRAPCPPSLRTRAAPAQPACLTGPENRVRNGPGSISRHAHPERLHLRGQRLAEPLHRKLGRVVKAPPRVADQSADRGKIEDVPAAPLRENAAEKRAWCG